MVRWIIGKLYTKNQGPDSKAFFETTAPKAIIKAGILHFLRSLMKFWFLFSNRLMNARLGQYGYCSGQPKSSLFQTQ